MDKQSEFSNFQYIWHTWIVPLITKMYQGMDSEYRDFVGAQVCNLDKLEVMASKFFQSRRSKLKMEYYGKEEENLEEHRLDFCKLSAILCRTLIEYKVIKFDLAKCKVFQEKIDRTNVNWLVKNALVNYRIAFLTSIVFLYQSMLFRYKDEAFIDNLRHNKKLDLYSGYSREAEHESFENYIVLNLSKRDLENKAFDYLSYSAILLGLEEYNKLLLSK